MQATYKNCQSCGMPLKRDEKGGGSNADGSRSLTYCSKCYESGKFKQSDIKLDGMKIIVKKKLKEFGFPGFLAGFFTRNMHKLERWKK